MTDERAQIHPRANRSYAVPPNNKGINRNPAEAAASSIPPHARRPLHLRRLNISRNEIRYLAIDNGPTVARHSHGNNDSAAPPAARRAAPSSFLEFLKGESGRMGGMKDKTGEECVAGTRGHDLFIRTELLGQRKHNNVLRFRVRSPLRH